MGILVLEGSTMKDIEASFPRRGGSDLMKDVIPHLLEIEKPVYGFLSNAFWCDIGSVEAYEKLDHNYIEKSLAYLFK